MPSGYEIEALKAQAVCARSYAYRQIARDTGYPEYEAHVDDSTNYQVYGNSAPADSADLAVQETAGQVVRSGRRDCDDLLLFHFLRKDDQYESLGE